LSLSSTLYFWDKTPILINFLSLNYSKPRCGYALAFVSIDLVPTGLKKYLRRTVPVLSRERSKKKWGSAASGRRERVIAYTGRYIQYSGYK
jgi:hypothetical protein